MSFSVDQFMQVKCIFQLTSESESSESLITNNEQIRLCTSVDMDDNNSVLIAMVCTNETGNNHVLAYYMERRHNQHHNRLSLRTTKPDISLNIEHNQAVHAKSAGKNTGTVTFADLAALSTEAPSRQCCDNVLGDDKVKATRRVKTKPRVIVKQIYYHDYNEDIVAICLSENGTKLVLVNASSTVYVIPIKNIVLNLYAQQLRSSQGRSMYFYDASILACAQSFADPVDVVYWESLESKKAFIIIASHTGKLIYLDAHEKRVICSTAVGEPIKSIKVMRDKYSYSLMITCSSLNQYRQVLELLDQNAKVSHDSNPTVISLPPSSKRTAVHKESSPASEQSRQPPSWTSKPMLIRPLSHQSGATAATNSLQRVLLPSASRFGSQASLISCFNDVRERPICLVGHQQPNLISLVDVLAPNCGQSQSRRILRFYSDKQYFYQPQRPQIICKLDSLDPDELITKLILTDRFIALTTDRDRCIVNSRNCCKLKNALGTPQQDLSPLLKEITFNHEEKILLLIKSPAVNDLDNIIDSFLLVTTRSIYSIEARHSCRDLFVNLIDSHLAIKRTLFMSRPRPDQSEAPPSPGRRISSTSEDHLAIELNNKFFGRNTGKRYKQSYDTRNAESNLLINSFLQHRDAYERVCHDSLAFSTLFEVELTSLYEACADRMLQRGQLELANQFFQMSAFGHITILGKYIRVGAHKVWYGYIKSYLNYIGSLDELQSDILKMVEVSGECRIAISLYRAIYRDQVLSKGSLANLFKNEFLMKLLSMTLALMSPTAP